MLYFTDALRGAEVTTFLDMLPPRPHRVVELLLYMHRAAVQDARRRIQALYDAIAVRRNARVIRIAVMAVNTYEWCRSRPHHEIVRAPSPAEVARMQDQSPTAPGVHNHPSPLSPLGMQDRYRSAAAAIATNGTLRYNDPQPHNVIRSGFPEIIPQPRLPPYDYFTPLNLWSSEWRLPAPSDLPPRPSKSGTRSMITPI